MRLSYLVWMAAALIAFGLGVNAGYDVAVKRKPATSPVFQSCGPTHVMPVGDGVLRVVTDVDMKLAF